MDVIGIICEYNPFHNGHIYHIQKIKEKYPNSLIILILNGYFLQRGEISILSKENKTKIAINNGIDIVMELPTIFGSQSADNFANSSISILNKLGVSKIIFGSECNDKEKLTHLAKAQNSPEFVENLKKYLQQGLNYPTALSLASSKEFTYNPNDILGISYIKSILNNNFNISYETIKRTNDYHNIEGDDEIISGVGIRARLASNESIDKYVPKEVLSAIESIDTKRYFHLLKVKILTDNHLLEYLDVDEGIEYRLQKHIKKAQTFTEFINLIKTKRYTYNRLNRMFIHILLGIPKTINEESISLKVLGFTKKGQKYLKKIKYKNVENKTIWEYERKASIIYDIICHTNTYEFELKNKPVIKD